MRSIRHHVPLVLALSMVPMTALAATVTPDAVKQWFDLAFVPILWAVGALYAKLPALKNFPNAAIPWLNAVVYILGRLIVPSEAQAASGVVGFIDQFWLPFRGIATSVLASVLWDKLLASPIGRYIPNAKPDWSR